MYNKRIIKCNWIIIIVVYKVIKYNNMKLR